MNTHRASPITQTSIARGIFLLAAPLLLSPSAASAQSAAVESIIDGTPVANSAVMYLEIGGSERCTAFMVTPQAALTAAHCLQGARPSDLELCDAPARGTCFRVSDATSDPRFTMTAADRFVFAAHDIAVLWVREEPRRSFIPMRRSEFTAAEAILDRYPANVVLYGYGVYDRSRLDLASDVLRSATVPLIERPGAGRSEGEYRTGLMMSGGGSNCFGDSGGPGVDSTGLAFGVISSTDDRSCSVGAYLAPVASSLPWICPFLERHADATGAHLCGYATASVPGQSGGGCSVQRSGASLAWAVGLFSVLAGVLVRRRR